MGALEAGAIIGSRRGGSDSALVLVGDTAENVVMAGLVVGDGGHLAGSGWSRSRPRRISSILRVTGPLFFLDEVATFQIVHRGLSRRRRNPRASS